MNMEENFNALDVIARTRGKVELDSLPSGDRLFPLWGGLAAIFYLAEFLLWQWLHQEWCLWLWVGVPLLGIPFMILILRRDRQRSHLRTRTSRLVLDYWIFAACSIGMGGFIFDFAGLYEMVENPLICMLVGIGAFITGGAVRFRPMTVGGLLGAGIGIGSFLLQGDLWAWQMLCVVAVSVVALIIPGCLFERYVRRGV